KMLNRIGRIQIIISKLKTQIGLRWDFSPVPLAELAGVFQRQISMTKNSNQFLAHRDHSFQKTASGKKRGHLFPPQVAQEKQRSPGHGAPVRPARELMIGLGWLQLFRAIVSPPSS